MSTVKKALELTPEEYRLLLERVVLGTYIQEVVSTSRLEDTLTLQGAGIEDPLLKSLLEDGLDSRAIEQKLLAAAEKFGWPELVTQHGDHLDFEERNWQEIKKVFDEFANDEFWDRLAEELGRRDFRRVASPEELAQIEATGRYPARAEDFVERYHSEFEISGTDRLEINLIAPIDPKDNIERGE